MHGIETKGLPQYTPRCAPAVASAQGADIGVPALYHAMLMYEGYAVRYAGGYLSALPLGQHLL